MSKIDDRDALIAAIINSTLFTKGDTLCVSDHINGARDLLKYYLEGYTERYGNRSHFRIYSTRGYLFVELLTDNVVMDEIDVSGLPRSVSAKYRKKTRGIGFNPEHDDTVAALYETIGTAPPKSWVSKPFTTVKCAEPRIDLKLDGHLNLHEVAHKMERDSQNINDRMARKKPNPIPIPNGPAPVTIRHITEMVQDILKGIKRATHAETDET